MSLPPSQEPGAATPDISPEFIFSKIQNFSSLLQDISLNVPSKKSLLAPDQSADSSLGLLPAEAVSEIDTSTTTMDMEDNTASTLDNMVNNISLGRYLQPVTTSQSLPLSDSEEENDVEQPPPSNPPYQGQPPEFVAPHQKPFTNNIDPSPLLPSNIEKRSAPACNRLSDNSVGEFESSAVFPWDKLVQGEGELSKNMSNIQRPPLLPDLSWQQQQDPSFCSGKFSARSTSFGGDNNTRDENFSDFGTIPSFQSQESHYSLQSAGGAFSGVDAADQAELGAEFGDQEFGSFGKEQLMGFLDQEEAECLEANPFMEEERCDEEPSNSSVFSGVSDKSIMLRNSNLLGGNTSKVNLDQLRMENKMETRVSRCEYFRHNSSRLGSLEDSVADSERPGLGFVHSIRSPERKPCALLSASMTGMEASKPASLSGTFSKAGLQAQASLGMNTSGSSSSDSAPSSANTTYMHSGNSTKTVVSLMDQSGTLKASELASRLQTLADQLGGGQAMPSHLRGVKDQSASYPDVVEDSISSSQGGLAEEQLEASIRESVGAGKDINLSTISKVLSEASVSSDPQHFVSVLLDCLKKREHADHGGEVECAPSDPTEAIARSMASEERSTTPKSGRTATDSNRSTPSTLPRRSSPSTPSSSNPNKTQSTSKSPMVIPTPSPTQPMLKTKMSGSSSVSKPIKPFNKKPNAVPCNQVAPVRPQPTSQPHLATSPTIAAPSTPVSMTASLPTSHKRKVSVARHSSPVKRVQPTTSLSATPEPGTDLSQLLESVETPSFHLASSNHLTTSTPFHNGLNLSTVILNHVAQQRHSVSSYNHPNTSIHPVTMSNSTTSPTLSVAKPVLNSPDELTLPRNHSVIQLSSDWTHNSVVSTYSRVSVPVPIQHNLARHSSMLVKITSMWVGSCLVPPQHWSQLGDIENDQHVQLEEEHFILEMVLKKAGTFTFNIAVQEEKNGVTSTGLVRLQVEEPNIQVLTENGRTVEFGSLPTDCSTSVQIVLVNCGAASAELVLDIKAPNQLFSFSDGSKVSSFTIPGLEGRQVDGQGVAKEVEIFVNTAGINVEEPRVFKTEMLLMLGKDDILLGSMDIMVRVGTAKLRMKKIIEPVQFYCLPGESVTQSVLLGNSGNISLTLETTVENMSTGIFTSETSTEIAPNTDISFPITFTCSPNAAMTSNLQTLSLTVMPNGPKHQIKLQANIVPTKESVLQFQSSRPVLSFGTIKKPGIMAQQEDVPTVFPVESDRSIINFLSVPVGTTEEQIINLRNSTSETVSLNMIIRETENFFLVVPAGLVSTSQIVLASQDTKEVKVLFRPTMLGTTGGKLVLKPQGRKVGGKSIKATIGLCGVAGSSNIVMEGVEEVEHNRYQVACQEMPIMSVVKFVNKGESMGFVNIVCDHGCVDTKMEIAPSLFLLEPGHAKEVLISIQEEVLHNPMISVFTGPELLRQVFKRTMQMPGASMTNNNPALMGARLLEEFPGEKVANLRENFRGPLAAVDGKQFYQKTLKLLLSLSLPSKAVGFDALTVEETLSETRIDQSIAMAVPVSVGKMLPVTRQQRGCLPGISENPSSPPTSDSNLVLIPSNLSLTSGQEAIVKLVNKSAHPVHWDLSCSVSHLSITPHAGHLSPHAQAVLCVQANTTNVPWQGEVKVYSDNSIAGMQVIVTPSHFIDVSTNLVDIGSVLIGSTTTGSLIVTNPASVLVQWKAEVSPSFFSLPQCAGLLNPSQSVSLPILFKPAAAGPHTASLSLTAVPLNGGQKVTTSKQVIVTLTGTALTGKDASTTAMAKQQAKKSSGTVSLESEVVMFPDTLLGETTVSKVKIKNRSGSDQAVKIVPPPSNSPFRTMHSVLEVKNQCYCTVPLQFRPTHKGDYMDTITFLWEGNMIKATLRGKSI